MSYFAMFSFAMSSLISTKMWLFLNAFKQTSHLFSIPQSTRALLSSCPSFGLEKNRDSSKTGRTWAFYPLWIFFVHPCSCPCVCLFVQDLLPKRATPSKQNLGTYLVVVVFKSLGSGFQVLRILKFIIIVMSELDHLRKKPPDGGLLLDV